MACEVDFKYLEGVGFANIVQLWPVKFKKQSKWGYATKEINPLPLLSIIITGWIDVEDLVLKAEKLAERR